MIPSRLYGELSWVWPLMDDENGYSRKYTDLLFRAFDVNGPTSRSMLHLGCGSGRYDMNLTDRFSRLVGVDQSAEMLALAAQACPSAEYVRGDIRSVRIAEKFDCVFIDDALMYLLDEDDVARTLATAASHLKPEGTLVLSLDAVAESCPRLQTVVSTADSQHKPDGIEIAYFRSYHKPDPDDPRCEATFVFVIHQDGARHVEVDEHLTAVRNTKEWQGLLESTGLSWEELDGPEWGPGVFYRCVRRNSAPDAEQ